MKNIFFTFLILIVSNHSYAQAITENTVTAFEESYKFESNKEYDKAINSIKSIAAAGLYEANFRTGWLYYSKGDYIQASKYYQAAIKSKSKSIEAYLGFANAQVALQNWDKVFETYKTMLVIDANNSVVNYRIALMFYYRKDYVSAQAHLQRVLDHYPFDYDSMLLMAQVKAAAGKISEAKVWYQKVLLYNPSDSSIKKIVENL